MIPELLEDRMHASDAVAERGAYDTDMPTSNLLVPADAGEADSTPTCVVDAKPLCTPDPFPKPGDSFQGFTILSELGRGATGRVFLARQPAPTLRTVVLKLGLHLSSECRKLAKLQHPNIVPVYSFHQQDRVQAVCMPYRGPLTLAHLVSRLRSEDYQTLDGRALTTAIIECRKSRQPSVEIIARPPEADLAVASEPGSSGKVSDRAAELYARLRGLNYTDAILSIIRQVVEGLRVAHGERIVHCDLKPANVLIADDGCAQLLDFGIAFDKTNLAAELLRLGGTRPYMSPEQLTSFATSELEHDERSDLYSVGVMLYELLTGRLPFEADFDSAPAAIERDRSNRFFAPPPMQSLNPRIPCAVASIVGKCLAPEIADRYQAATHLLEDLDRQLAHRALRFAPNTSRRELASKWGIRNRFFLAAAGLLVAAGAVSGAFALRDSQRADELRRMEVFAAGEPFATDLEESEFYFGLADREPEYRERAWSAAHRALERFQARDDDEWFRRPEFASLSPDRLELYRRQVAGLNLLLANSRAQEAARQTDAPAREKLLLEAREWNHRAERNHPAAEGCRAVWVQRGFLSRLGGDPAAAERYARQAERIPRDAADAVLEGRQFMMEDRVQAALAVLKEAVRLDPKNFWAVFYSSACQQMLGEYRDAVTGYDLCGSLRPGFFGTSYNRGLSRLRLGLLAEAEGDFNRTLEARPNWADAHFQRALAREFQKRYADAMDDLNRCLELGYPPTSVLLVRSRVHGRMGDKLAAERDFADGIKAVPTDERGWLARAQARLYREPAAALADYDEALKLNPRLISALQGKAHLLSTAGKNDAAAQALTRIIDINPDSPDAWSGRAVMRARQGDRDGAVADAREALRLTERPGTKYQVAGVYALSSKANPADLREAYSLLDSALRDGFGFEYLDKDPELDPIRKDPDFKKLVDAARAYRASLKKQD